MQPFEVVVAHDGSNNVNTMFQFYYSFFISTSPIWYWILGTRLQHWFAVCFYITKACLRVILKIKPRDHVTSNFKTLNIMPIKMLANYCILKHRLKNYSILELNTIAAKPHDYNTRLSSLKPIHTNNMRGERSLLCNGIKLYNRYLLGARTGVETSSWFGLADLLWADG